MTYPDDGTLRAWLDGELDRVESRELEDRMDQDPDSRSMLEGIRARETRVNGLLTTLDVDGKAPAERVRAVLRALRTESPEPAQSPSLDGAARRRASVRWARGIRLAQAAILVLLFGGAAAAAIIPGSAIRTWLAEALDIGPDPTGAPPPSTPGSDRGEAGGLIVAPGRNRFEVDLVGVPEGTDILVALVPGDTAAIYAPEGSQYEWDAEIGRARAEVGGGPIHLTLPEEVDVDLIVDGRVYMSRRGERIDLRVSPTHRSATEIRFRAGN